MATHVVPKRKGLICVECAKPVPELYNDNASPGNIKLAICVCYIVLF